MPKFERRLVHVLEQHGNARVGKDHRDASAHGAGADNRHAIHGQHRSFLGNVGNLRHLAFAKENVDERFRLIGEKALGEKLSLDLAAFLERQFGRRFYRIDRRQRSFQSSLFLGSSGARRRKNRRVLLGRSQFSQFALVLSALACRRLRARTPLRR
jgi:hypothetical protein